MQTLQGGTFVAAKLKMFLYNVMLLSMFYSVHHILCNGGKPMQGINEWYIHSVATLEITIL